MTVGVLPIFPFFGLTWYLSAAISRNLDMIRRPRKRSNSNIFLSRLQFRPQPSTHVVQCEYLARTVEGEHCLSSTDIRPFASLFQLSNLLAGRCDWSTMRRRIQVLLLFPASLQHHERPLLASRAGTLAEHLVNVGYVFIIFGGRQLFRAGWLSTLGVWTY